eukprot:351575-Chlamydomonas_euryale.AAC.6
MRRLRGSREARMGWQGCCSGVDGCLWSSPRLLSSECGGDSPTPRASTRCLWVHMARVGFIRKPWMPQQELATFRKTDVLGQLLVLDTGRGFNVAIHGLP